MTATRDGEELAGLNIEDWSYEIGQGWVTEDFDEKLIGAKVGEELSFSSTPKGTEEEADFTVKLSAVKSLALPDVDDAWVKKTSASTPMLRVGMRPSKSSSLTQSSTQFDRRSGRKSPTPWWSSSTSMRLSRWSNKNCKDVCKTSSASLRHRAWILERGCRRPGSRPRISSPTSVSKQKVRSKQTLRCAQLQVAENIAVDGEDLELEYTRLAMQFNDSSDNVRRAYEQNGAVGELTASVKKSKAFDWLLHNIEFVDTMAQIDGDTVLGRP